MEQAPRLNSKQLRPTILPGRWISLDGQSIRRLRSNERGNQTYSLGRQAASISGFVGEFNHHNGVVIVGAPDGTLKVAPHTDEVIKHLTDAGYRRREIMAVPDLLEDELFEDTALQAAFLALRKVGT